MPYLNKFFGSKFLDAYYILSKDKCSNVLIKLSIIAPNIYKKVSYGDSRNKERIVNILKGLIESEKIKPHIKTYVTEAYAKIASMASISSTEQQLRDEEEKNFIEHEKDIAKIDKIEYFKDKRLGSSGLTRSAGYENRKFSSNRNTPADPKSGIPKTSSQSKFKKSLKKKKDPNSAKVKTKSKKSDKMKVKK